MMKCIVCSNSLNNKHYKIRETMYGTGDSFDYFQCANCGCLQVLEIPLELSNYYPSDYHKLPEKNNIIKHYIKKLRNNYAIFNEGNIGKILYNIYPNAALRSLSNTKILKNSKILDVGCGAGMLLFELLITGFTNLVGIDPYINNEINYSHKLMIHKKYLYELKGKYDLIIFNHSFEHIPNQIDTLLYISEILDQRGNCILRIPTSSSFAWQHYKENWVQIDAPRHLFLHSIESITLLAKMGGFYIDKIVYDSNEFQFWGSEQNRRNIPLRSNISFNKDPQKSIFTKSEIKTFEVRAKELNEGNRGDQASFFLKLLNANFD